MDSSSDEEEYESTALNIALNSVPENTEYHRKNNGRVQQPEVWDSDCKGLKISGRLCRVIHGFDKSDGRDTPATFIIIGFRFRGNNQARRLRFATINITFRSEDDSPEGRFDDPIVVGYWPDERESMEEVVVDYSTTNSIGGNVNVGFYGVGVGGELGREESKSLKKIARATVDVSSGLGPPKTDGEDNMVSITIEENKETMSGVPDLQIPILLHRKNNDRFLADISVKGKGGFGYNFSTFFKPIIGGSPINDPVIFDPQKPPLLGRVTDEDRKTWAQDLKPEELGSLNLELFWKRSFFRQK